MKIITKLFVVVAGSLLFACNAQPTPIVIGSITIEDESKLNQALVATDTQCDITFTTQNSWQMTTADAWITITPQSGAEGKSTVVMSVSANDTSGGVRYGKVEIVSKESKVTINIKQEYRPIEYDGLLVDKIYSLNAKGDTVSMMRFDYDQRYRLTKYFSQRVAAADTNAETSTYQYADGIINVHRVRRLSVGGTPYKDVSDAVVTLNKVKAITKYDVKHDDGSESILNFSYDNGYLTQVVDISPRKENPSTNTINYAWELDNITQVTQNGSPYLRAIYGQAAINPSYINFDFAAYFVANEVGILSAMGYQGLRCRNLPVEIRDDDGYKITISYRFRLGSHVVEEVRVANGGDPAVVSYVRYKE